MLCRFIFAPNHDPSAASLQRQLSWFWKLEEGVKEVDDDDGVELKVSVLRGPLVGQYY
jgi:hypothetical protein